LLLDSYQECSNCITQTQTIIVKNVLNNLGCPQRSTLKEQMMMVVSAATKPNGSNKKEGQKRTND
jgi:hypothetical protein